MNVGSSASTDRNAPLDAAAIDAIFTQGGHPLYFDMAPGDLAGLSAIEKDLDALSIGVNNEGRFLKGTTAWVAFQPKWHKPASVGSNSLPPSSGRVP
jgi:hypothetical protein